MQKLVFFTEESVFAGSAKCGIGEVVDSLALSVAEEYEVTIIAKSEDLSLAKVLANIIQEEVKVAYFQSIKFYLIEESWPQRGIEIVNQIKGEILHVFSCPEIIKQLSYSPQKTIYAIDNIEYVKNKLNILEEYDHITFPSLNYTKEVISSGLINSETLKEKIFNAPIGVSDIFFNPEQGLFIPYKYKFSDLSGKQNCKERITESLSLSKDAPLFLCMCRMVEEKGIDLILQSLPLIKNKGGNLVVVGSGEKYNAILSELSSQNEIYYINKKFTPLFALQFLAGADYFLSPSLVEPGGLMPMTASLYGTIPIVSQAGGLKDNFNDDNAIIIKNYDLQSALQFSFDLYQNKTEFFKKASFCMVQHFGWNHRKKNFQLMYMERE